MRGVFPGRPQSALHAVDTALWSSLRIVTYISGSNLIILRAPHDLFQTISLDAEAALQVVAIDALSGKIALTDGNQVFIYAPIGQEYGALRWTFQAVYAPPKDQLPITCLSWGLPGELLVSSSHLVLLNTDDALRIVWRSGLLANPAKIALFSHDASLIASCGHHDRLAKVWRRGFIGGGNERFDPVYIGHPAAVTAMRWRKRRPQQEDTEDENTDPVLYTTCTDGKLRVWTAHDPHCLQVLRLWTELDMFTAIQPREPLSPGAGHKRRFAAILDHWAFEAAVAAACQTEASEERKHHTRKHLQELADRSPEVAVIFDDEGNMSAWGLERVACKARQANDVLNLTNVEGLGLELAQGLTPAEDFATLHVFSTDAHINLLTHYFDGRIQWSTGLVDHLFDPSPGPTALQLASELTGHGDPIERVFSSGALTMSASQHGELIVWRREHDTLSRQSYGRIQEKTLDASIYARSSVVFILTPTKVTLLDASEPRMQEIAQHQLSRSTTLPLQARLSAIKPLDQNRVQVGTVSCHEDGVQVDFFEGTVMKNHQTTGRIQSLSSHSLATTHTNGIVNKDSHSDHHEAISADFLFSFNSIGLQSPTVFSTYRLSGSSEHAIFRPAGSHALPVGKAAHVSSNGDFLAWTDESGLALQILNLSTGFTEFTQTYDPHDPVQSLRWTKRGDQVSGVLAVVFSHRISVLCPRTCQPASTSAWFPVQEISLSDLTSITITDACWVSSSGLLVAAGIQMFVMHVAPDVAQDQAASLGLSKSATRDRSLLKVVQSANTQLPLYHPTSLTAILDGGDTDVFLNVFKHLDASLKYYAEGDDFSSLLGKRASNIRFSLRNDPSDPSDDDSFDQDALISIDMPTLLERLDHTPWLLRNELENVKHIARSVSKLAEQQRSVDSFAGQFLSSLYLRTDDEEELSWMSIFQASQTTSHDILVDQVKQRHNDQLRWCTAKKTGLFLWLADIESLRTHLETVARAEYTKTEERNPIDCALYYLALRKKAVLTNLWRMATWHKEQRMTHKMLQNDFADARWKTAALKNAYALLGKRRSEYAASWFLLADDLRGAVGVLAAQCNDLRLAVTVARAYEGDDGPVLRELLEQKVLPLAFSQDNRYMAAWAFWLLGQKDKMLRAFLDPFDILMPHPQPSPHPTPLPPRHLRRDDAALAHTYKRARDAVAVDPRAAKATLALPVASEHRLALRAALALMRMGLGVLALDLLRTFTFSKHIPAPKTTATLSARTRNGAHAVRDVEEEGGAAVPSALDAFFADDASARASPTTRHKQDTQSQSEVEDEGEGSAAPSALSAFLSDPPISERTELGAIRGEDDANGGGGAAEVGQEDTTTTTAEKKKKKPAVAPSERSILDDFDF